MDDTVYTIETTSSNCDEDHVPYTGDLIVYGRKDRVFLSKLLNISEP